MKSRSVALLSGEATSVPQAEARALFLAYDPTSTFESPEPRVLISESAADPFVVASRAAFCRRVGVLVAGPSEAEPMLTGRKVRVRQHSLAGDPPEVSPGELLRGMDVSVDLKDPDLELSVIKGRGTYLAVTAPRLMRQGWSVRRPRRRPFFHPSAIFPKLSRALVNLTRVKEGEVFLEPFAGTGSLALEAHILGAKVVALDRSAAMVRGAAANMRAFGQEWLGVARCDSLACPVTRADAAATDVPYGRLSSTMGMGGGRTVSLALQAMAGVVRGGGRLVLMHPSTVPGAAGEGWAVEEEHCLYVHKLLTRAITVFRRE